MSENFHFSGNCFNYEVVLKPRFDNVRLVYLSIAMGNVFSGPTLKRSILKICLSMHQQKFMFIVLKKLAQFFIKSSLTRTDNI